jgi:hypothetical protein
MPVPIIEPEDKHPDEQLHIRLRPEIAQDLRAYGEYASSSTSHIISAALKRLFAADKGFKVFKDEHPSGNLISRSVYGSMGVAKSRFRSNIYSEVSAA